MRFPNMLHVSWLTLGERLKALQVAHPPRKPLLYFVTVLYANVVPTL